MNTKQNKQAEKINIIHGETQAENFKRVKISSFFRFTLYFIGIFVPLLLFALTSFVQYKGMLKDAEKNAKNNVNFIANSINTNLTFYKNLASILSNLPVFAGENTNIEEKVQILQNISQTYNFKNFDIINNSGYALKSKQFVGDKDFFLQSQNGNTFVSTQSKKSQKEKNIQNIIISTPIFKTQNEISGTLYFEIPINLLYNFEIFNNSASLFPALPPNLPRNAEQNQHASPNAQNNLPQNSITQTHFAVFDKYFSPIIIKSSENIENEKFQNILKHKSNSTFVTKINQTSQKFLIAKCQIENTENWQIVIFSPIKSVLKGFYKTNTSKILSLLVLILFTELAIYFLNKKITKPIIQTSKQLQKAVNANITSLECKETFIAESDKIVKSASKIIDKLNISLALEEDFGSSSTLSDLISPLVLKNILNFYTKPQYEGLNLILSKSNGSFLMSSKPISQNFTKTQGENFSTTPIKLENRIIGLIEFQIEENSKITEFIAKQIIENVAGQLSIFVEANYHQSLFYKSQIAKLQRSLINFAKINSKILSQLKPLIFKISNMHSEDFFNYSLLRAEKEKTNILNSLHQIAKQVDNSVEHSVKNELLISLTEKPYTLEELVNSIKKIELAQKPKAKCKISIKTSENLPKTLFGDKNYIIRLVMWTEEMLLKSGNNKIEINIDAIKGTYNFNLKITIQNSLQVFSSQYLEKINAYLNGNFMAFGENENFSNETWRLISIIRIVKMQNGVIKFLQTENNCSKIEIFIPQIETKGF